MQQQLVLRVLQLVLFLFWNALQLGLVLFSTAAAGAAVGAPDVW
jgi:hypothetical protein